VNETAKGELKRLREELGTQRVFTLDANEIILRDWKGNRAIRMSTNVVTGDETMYVVDGSTDKPVGGLPSIEFFDTAGNTRLDITCADGGTTIYGLDSNGTRRFEIMCIDGGPVQIAVYDARGPEAGEARGFQL